MKLGACHVEDPFIALGQICTGLYFSYFTLIIPGVSIIENSLMGFIDEIRICVGTRSIITDYSSFLEYDKS